MHVRSRYTAVLCLALSALAGGAQAVGFDEKLKAPQAKTAAEIGNLAESYSATFARLEAASPAESVTHKTLFLDHFELKWQVQQALDAKRSLGDLSAVGLETRDDGSIHIDLSEHPQWDPFPRKLASLLPTMNLEGLGPLLVNRGFRDSDVAALGNYIATHDLKAATYAKTLPVAVSFSRLVKKYDKLKVPVSNRLVLSYIYQRSRAEALAQLEWAQGLLGVLDAQRVRVLHSYLSELQGESLWAPDDIEAGISGLLTLMRLPDYEQRATAEARGVTP
jgi:hypothetical protein